MNIEFDKIDLAAFASLMKVLRDIPCYDHVGDSVRVRMCRGCSDDVVDNLADFVILHLRRGWAEAEPTPPHEDPLEKELEELPF